MTERLTIENGQESEVNEDTDYPCEECTTSTLEIWHTR